MYFSEETSLGNYGCHCSLEIDDWIIFTFKFILMSATATLVQQIWLMGPVLKPIALHPKIVKGEMLCLFPKNVNPIVEYLFETLNLLVPFPCHEFVSLLRFASFR